MPNRASALARLLTDGLFRRAMSITLLRREPERLVPVPVRARLTGPPRARLLPGPKHTKNTGNPR